MDSSRLPSVTTASCLAILRLAGGLRRASPVRGSLVLQWEGLCPVLCLLVPASGLGGGGSRASSSPRPYGSTERSPRQACPPGCLASAWRLTSPWRPGEVHVSQGNRLQRLAFRNSRPLSLIPQSDWTERRIAAITQKGAHQLIRSLGPTDQTFPDSLFMKREALGQPRGGRKDKQDTGAASEDPSLQGGGPGAVSTVTPQKGKMWDML